MLKETFLKLLEKYTNSAQALLLWTEIEKNYSTKKRHYHTLTHLHHLLNQLLEIKDELKNWEAILFSLYYHDSIYNALKSDNEEQSALLAEKRMKQIAVPPAMIELCKQQILATKSHVCVADSDTNYFTDADLAILGQEWKTYSTYFENVRKEYAIYPNLMYNPGRKKVLTHFLTMERIFKTDFFYNKFEKIAKQNLQKEYEVY
jgi:predicted metal-dependent HD superfamily phosphohydrolase